MSADTQALGAPADVNPALPGAADTPVFGESVLREPVFREPWEARAFAMAVSLQGTGLFTWDEWARTLGEEIRRAQGLGDPDSGASYYRHWLATLERILGEKGVASAALLARYRHAWDHAADRTPHGQPIDLWPEDFHD